MRAGLWVLYIAAVMWSVAGILLSHVPLWWTVFPTAISAAILAWARSTLRAVPRQTGGSHVGRVVGFWTVAEGVSIVVAVNALLNVHKPDTLMPAIAIIVGLHFLGLARGIPAPTYWATGGALIAIGGAALIAHPFESFLMTGLLVAAALWASAVSLVNDARRAR